ncbi:MAG: glycoside hydrolase family 130 protein [Acidimicrobiia bacterium]|nr:glycoside hydrolase family 130 protein [Acidimicrobiia bacterium]MDH5521115.1 glycoside hydrolase family 130 protein [Acidimicrobiia bacterium]
MSVLPVSRSLDVRLMPDPGRVITKAFLPGEQVPSDGRTRLEAIVGRILGMDEALVGETLREVSEEFVGRHRDFDAVLRRHLEIVADRVTLPDHLSPERQLLIGAYCTHEYSIEAAALGNPSMVVAPDQSNLGAGETRFIMSLRAVGEGHISSIEFRCGVIDQDLGISLDATTRYAETGRREGADYDKGFFVTKMSELGALNDIAHCVLASLGSRFTMSELETALGGLDAGGADCIVSTETSHILHWLASSNYYIDFRQGSDISERVIFPAGPTESHGMEDVRLVRFVHDNGSVVYYGTYTAFDGHQILPQLLETTDFLRFRIATLSGPRARNKGIALFPRMLDGQFVALGRHDNVNNFVMRSADVRVWPEAQMIQEPKRPWEFVQLGNCGSPIETDEGWLVITHGVGPLRRYSLGAMLLDLDDPCRVIGHLKEPLLSPQADEREGYVPNVVYSCGSMVVGDHLVLPYGFADVGAAIATVPLDQLLSRLTGT